MGGQVPTLCPRLRPQAEAGGLWSPGRTGPGSPRGVAALSLEGPGPGWVRLRGGLAPLLGYGPISNTKGRRCRLLLGP